MNAIKYFKIIYFFFIPLLFSCSQKEQPVAGLSVNIKLLKEYFVNDSISIGCNPMEYIKNKRFDIQIALENSSDTAMSIVIMTCSWEESFLINTPYFEYVGKACDGNYPYKVIIKAHDKFILNANLEKSKYINECETCPAYSKTAITKLGFIYIPFNQEYIVSNYESVMEDKSRWHIIWSNPLSLNKQE